MSTAQTETPTRTCPVCGFQWKEGENAGHVCARVVYVKGLERDLAAANAQLATIEKLANHPESLNGSEWSDGVTLDRKILKLLDERGKFRACLALANEFCAKREAELANEKARAQAAEGQVLALREVLGTMLSSASPHPTHNPKMHAAWKVGEAALSQPAPEVVPLAEHERVVKALINLHDAAVLGECKRDAEGMECAAIHEARPIIEAYLAAHEARKGQQAKQS